MNLRISNFTKCRLVFFSLQISMIKQTRMISNTRCTNGWRFPLHLNAGTRVYDIVISSIQICNYVCNSTICWMDEIYQYWTKSSEGTNTQSTNNSAANYFDRGVSRNYLTATIVPIIRERAICPPNVNHMSEPQKS